MASTDRETFKHAAIYSIAATLSRVIGFILLPVYAHIFRDSGYGVIGMFDAGLGLLVSLLGYGIAGALVRFYHEHTGEKRNLVVSTGVLLVGGATLALVLVSMLLSRPFSWILTGDAAYWNLLCLALLTFFFDLTGRGAGALMIIERRSVLVSMISLLHLLLGVSLNILLIIVLKMGLLGYFLSNLLAMIVPSSIYVGYALRRCGTGFDRELARHLIRFQLPLIPGTLASYASRQVERILVRFMINLESVGVLQMAYRWPVILTQLIHEPFMRSWNTKRVEIAEEPDAPRRIGRMFTYSLYLMTFAGLLLAVSMRNLLEILTPPEFWPAHRIASIEIVTLTLGACYQHLSFGLFYAKDTRTMAYIRSVTSGVKIALSFTFISLWGMYGAAYSAMLTAVWTLIWGHRRSQARYRLRLEPKKIALMVVAAGTLYGVLGNTDFSRRAPLAGLVEGRLPAMIEGLRGTRVGDWRDGKVITILEERAAGLVDLAVKLVLASSFLVILPIVHEPTQQRLRHRLRPRGARRDRPGTPAGLAAIEIEALAGERLGASARVVSHRPLSAWKPGGSYRLNLRTEDGRNWNVLFKDLRGDPEGIAALVGLPVLPGPPEAGIFDHPPGTLAPFLPTVLETRQFPDGRHQLLLEDPGGAWRRPATAEDILLLVRDLPALHAALRTWAEERDTDALLDYGPDYRRELRGYIETNLAAYVRKRPSAIAEQVRDRLPELLDRIRELDQLGREHRQPIHGDLSPVNLRIEDGPPPSIKVLNWEWTGLGLPHADLAALLKTSGPSVEARAVAAYAEAVPELSADLHWRLYRRCRLERGLLDASFLAALELADRGADAPDRDLLIAQALQAVLRIARDLAAEDERTG